ncbi:8-amino-7-oxononanoate synthase [Segniliparus rotundus DSM 44985]|uniref:8-amino-7-oxononanoate synthase n=1 Tax=Segniliparus rotundus (strain ATCC BAA-972 / CDC 1076 / CIP 108378 / DSM 44985 / JCM 13578) TaxID=640132 RepID=D6ZDC2_SEGRD|nr:8-amino-7-oxononanoate synthase [Segniliparus rotundus]ADG97186.1 8-amino-7-oxononanoate synthase [Segniliparus rotundus DSM 44985]
MPEIARTSFQDWLEGAARRREQLGLRRIMTPKRVCASLLDFASNDYLGLSQDPRVLEGAAMALKEHGAGSTASRLVAGTTELHESFERQLAAFFGTEAALVFSSGYLANLAAVSALGGSDAVIVSDAGVHASLIDAGRLSRSRVVVTPSGSVESVRDALAARAEPRALVVVDSVSSVDGSLAPLVELHKLCQEFGAVLIADEAHALGVVGPGGRGHAYAQGVAGQPDVVLTATLSKALGGQGGAVLASGAVREHLLNSARSFIFDTALAPPCVGAAAAALGVLTAEPALPAMVLERAQELAERLGLAERAQSSVLSTVLGDPNVAVAVAAACREEGVLVGCFRPPSVPEGTSRIRFAVKATHSSADVCRAVSVFSESRRACLS